MTTSRTKNIEQVANSFVEKVKNVKEVREVRLVERGNGYLVWTLIEAPPFADNAIRDKVYAYQWEALKLETEPIADFRLTNGRELSFDVRDVTPDGRVLFKR